MNVGLDTSIILRLLVGAPPDQARRAAEFLDEVANAGNRAVVSDLVVSEVYFALQHHYGISKTEALAALRAMLDDGEIAPLGAAGEVLKTPGLGTANPGFVDRLIHAAYLSTAGAMATFERSSKKLPGTRVLT